MNIEKVGVVGTGQMGAGIAQVAAAAGHTVLLADLGRELAEKAKAAIGQRLASAVDKGKMDRASADGILNRLLPVESIADFKVVDLAIEAVAENVELKLRIFRDLDVAAPPHAILASNTSSISITLLAAATKRPEQVMGMHFMNPVPVMKLVELIRGLQTSDATFAAVEKLATRRKREVPVTPFGAAASATPLRSPNQD